nr:hypothetical protein [Tanacetum cinerariifolium]
MTLYNALPHRGYGRVFMCKTTKEVKSLALKAKVTREQTSNDSDSQGGSDEDVDEEEEAEAFNLIARNFPRVIGSDAKINLEMKVINSVKAVVIALATKVVKAQSKKELVTIAR